MSELGISLGQKAYNNRFWSILSPLAFGLGIVTSCVTMGSLMTLLI